MGALVVGGVCTYSVGALVVGMYLLCGGTSCRGGCTYSVGALVVGGVCTYSVGVLVVGGHALTLWGY